MHSFILKAVGTTLVAAIGVSCHGHVAGINVAGVWYEGYDPTVFPYKADPPTVVGWTGGNTNNGPVYPSSYASDSIICHQNSKPAGGYASVQLGDEIEAYWTPWPDSHKGPVINMLANCNGDCTTVSKTDLKFFKIAAEGLVDDVLPPGEWATDTLIANNYSWVIKIPEDLAEGNYVWRHEIIALHNAEDVNGAQNYPQCFNLAVTGTGSLAPTGTLGEALYRESDAGILLDIYKSLPGGYTIPGPSQIAAGTNLVQSTMAIKGNSPAIETGVSIQGHAASATTTAPIVKSASPAPSSTEKTRSIVPYVTPSAAATVASSSAKSSAKATATSSHSPCHHKSHHPRDFMV